VLSGTQRKRVDAGMLLATNIGFTSIMPSDGCQTIHIHSVDFVAASQPSDGCLAMQLQKTQKPKALCIYMSHARIMAVTTAQDFFSFRKAMPVGVCSSVQQHA
jgi:hypothetical protein